MSGEGSGTGKARADVGRVLRLKAARPAGRRFRRLRASSRMLRIRGAAAGAATAEDKNAVIPVDAAIQANLKETVTRVLASLTPREERVLRIRFGIGMHCHRTRKVMRIQLDIYWRAVQTSML